MVFILTYPNVKFFGYLVHDVSFSDFPPDIKRVDSLELLGSPLWGPDAFFRKFLTCRIDKVTSIQEKLPFLEEPQALVAERLSICFKLFLFQYYNLFFAV